MNRCPTELWAVIVQYACTDDGLTGCSLSRVSRTMQTISQPVRYQSVALTSLRRTTLFAAALRQLPCPPNIRHLLIVADNAETTPNESPGRALKAVFEAASPTLCTLFLHGSYFAISQVPVVPFPSLSSLTTPALRAVLSNSHYPLPSLRRLHINSSHNSPQIWRRISTHARSVTHVRLSGLQLDLDIAPFLRLLLDAPPPSSLALKDLHIGSAGMCYAPGSEQERSAQEIAARIPSIERVYVQPRAMAGPQSATQVHMETGLRDVALMCVGREKRKLFVLPARKRSTEKESREHWMDVVQGGDGPWAEVTFVLPSSDAKAQEHAHSSSLQ